MAVPRVEPEVEEFWRKTSLILWAANGFKKGGSPGMVFVGKYLREIMLEPNLAQLKLLLGDEADVAIDYLRATRELYDVCVRQHLDESYDYEDKIEAFREAFNAVHEAWGVPETVKVHIMCDHVGDYFAYTGNNKLLIESLIATNFNVSSRQKFKF